MQTLLFLIAGICQAIDIPRQQFPPTGNGTRLLTYNETAPGAKIAPSSTSFSWISGKEDGQYVYRKDDGSVVIQNVVTNSSETLVASDKVPEDAHDYWIKPDLSSVL